MATAAQIREHYDFFAPFYRFFWGQHIHHGLFVRGDESPEQAQIQMLEHCVKLAGIKQASRVLDVGCGHGATLIYLTQKLNGTGRGLTLSPRQADIATKSARKAGVGESVEFMVANADHYEFPAAAYDAVWTMESSEHFADKPRYFHNVAKTLKPGGKLLVAAWTGDMRSEKVRAVAEAFVCPELQTGDDYAAQIEAAGMQVTAREDVSAQVVRTWQIIKARVRWAAPVAKMFREEHSRFVKGIDVILDAYKCGDLTYTVLAAVK